MQPDRTSPQLLVDLSVLVGADDKSGVQRVVRNVLRHLLLQPPKGYAVAPIYDAGGHYAYAQRFINGEGEDTPIHVGPGDIFLGLDLAPNHVPGNRKLLDSLHLHGVKMFFVVYDLLPIKSPSMFIAGAKPWFEQWVSSVASVADGLVCISRAVADELLEWLDANPVARTSDLNVGWFHLGADLDASAPSGEVTQDEAAALAQLSGHQSMLMVGTLEPRKMHAQALAAFEQLWREGSDARLVIAGKEGWMVEGLAARLRHHPERGQRLFWFERASDAALRTLYAQCSGLLAPSAGEGFGLPLIEAAQHGLPVLARSLPVFHEVAGEHASYFEGDLAEAVRGWLLLQAEGKAAPSQGMPWMTWEQSTRQLVERITLGQWHGQASYRLR